MKSITHLLVVCLFFLSCRKDEKKQAFPLTSNNEIKIENKYYKVINYGANFKKENIDLSSSREKATEIHQVDGEMNEEELNTLFVDLRSQFSGDLSDINSSVVIIGIYSQPYLNNLTYDKMEAFSIVTKTESGFKHNFFLVKNGIASKVEQFTKDLSSYYSFNFQYLAFKFGDNSTGIAVFTSNANYSFDGFPINDFNSSIVNDLNLQDGFLVPNQDCGGACFKVVKDVPCDHKLKNGQWSYQCQGETGPSPGNDPSPICAARTINSVIIENSVNLDLLNLESIAFIRDSILKKYPFGVKYVDFYNKVSIMAVYFDFINIFNIKDSYSFAKKTQDVLLQFKDPNSSAIPITTEYKNFALQFSAQYQKLTTNTVYTEMLKAFESDIIRFEGKTVQQILNEVR